MSAALRVLCESVNTAAAAAGVPGVRAVVTHRTFLLRDAHDIAGVFDWLIQSPRYEERTVIGVCAEVSA